VTGEKPDSATLLQRAAARVSRDDAFVAAAFRQWCGDELDLEAIARELACDRSAAVLAAFCRKPRLDRFRNDVSAIAQSCRVDSNRLSELLRQAASIAAFRAGAGHQLLAAARDTPDDPEEPK